MKNSTQPTGAELKEIVWKVLRAHFSASDLEGAEVWFEESSLQPEPEGEFQSVLAIKLYHPNGEKWPHPAATAAAHSQLVFDASARGDSRLPMLYHTSLKPPFKMGTHQRAA
jgi:hypothetical protein